MLLLVDHEHRGTKPNGVGGHLSIERGIAEFQYCTTAVVPQRTAGCLLFSVGCEGGLCKKRVHPLSCLGGAVCRAHAMCAVIDLARETGWASAHVWPYCGRYIRYTLVSVVGFFICSSATTGIGVKQSFGSIFCLGYRYVFLVFLSRSTITRRCKVYFCCGRFV